MEHDKPVVLLVDDDSRNRELVRAILRTGHRLVEADSVRSALGLMEHEAVDLVLLDIMMPGINGYDGCRLFKERFRSRNEYVPVLLLTSLATQDDRNRGLEAGADDFLTKPIDRHELTLRLQTFVRLRRQDRLLHQQLEALKQAEELKDDLVSLLVHDLRNPLSGVTSMLDFMSGEVADESLREDLHLAILAGNRLKQILEDLLHVRRFESGTLELKLERIDTERLLDDAVASLAATARMHENRIRRAQAAPDPWIEADRNLLRRAVENLLSNAVKYSPRGAEISVAIEHVAGGIEIEIADRGCGVPQEFKEELFKKFGSIEAARGDMRRGFGLGLHLVKLVAVAHGGRALVRDRDGGGTAFAIFLPRAEAPATRSRAPAR